MARVKSGVTAKARHKKVLGKAKGYYGARSKLFKTAKQAVIKLDSTRIATVASANVSSVNCGLFVSMQLQRSWVVLIQE